jgi:putative flippase GtrA
MKRAHELELIRISQGYSKSYIIVWIMNGIILTIDRVFGRYATIVRYLISGGSAFGTNIVLLYLLTEYLDMYYLLSAVISFVFAFGVSFFMMKNFTFQDGESEKTHKQLVAYFSVAIFNLFLNSLLVFIFVEKFYIWYIFAQVVASLLIAVSSFFIYKHLIFKKPAVLI